MKQLCYPVMLPANKINEGFNGQRLWKKEEKLKFKEGEGFPYGTNRGYYLSGHIPQHLYITSSENPSVQGDWMFYGNRYSIKELRQFQKGIDSAAFLKEQGIRKVIATTNKNITSLAQIPEAFIKKFVESNGTIKEVLVKVYGEDDIAVKTEGEKIGTPILRSDNTIIISPSKTLNTQEVEEEKLKLLVSILEKAGIRKYTCLNGFGYSQIERDIVELLTSKTYTREEVILLLFKFENRPIINTEFGTRQHNTEWIEENL